MGRIIEDFLARVVARFGIRALDNPLESILLIGSIGLVAAVLFGLYLKRYANRPAVEMTPLEKLSHDENKFDLGRFLEGAHVISFVIAVLFLSKALFIALATAGWTRAATGQFFFEWISVLIVVAFVM